MKYSFKNLCRSAGVVVLVLLATACTKKTPITHLTCNYLVNPLGIDVQQPRFSWQSSDSTIGWAQVAYQIDVATDTDLLKKGKSDVWSSGRVESNLSVLIPFEGPTLQSRTRYYWMVTVWDNNGKKFKSNELAWFETGLLSVSDWQAEWISKPDSSKPLKSTLIRKTFNLKGEAKQARLYVTGLGNYQFFINGNPVTDTYFNPGWTDYHKRIQYQTFDVTKQLVEGNNAMGAMMGNMWWSSGLAAWQEPYKYDTTNLRLLAQLEVEYTDGTKEIIATDSTWKTDWSPITFNSLYDGETFDARRVQNGWNTASFNDSQWQTAVILNTPSKELLSAQNGPAIRINKELSPVKIISLPDSSYTFDFGQNFAGLVRLNVQGQPGDTIVLRFAELIHPDSTVAQENLRSAKVTDRYIIASTNPETWQAVFTYHGFRYVQVTGLRKKPTDSTLTGLVLHDDVPFTGSFSSSNQLLNQLWKNLTWGQRSNMMSVPTDCPQRDERLGWMGDAQIFAATSSLNMQMGSMYNKWLADVRDGQSPEGWVQDVHPAIFNSPAKPAWGDAVIIVPWVTYLYFGDKAILEHNYESMKQWVEWMRSKSKNDLYIFNSWNNDPWAGYGDWVPVTPSPSQPISVAFYKHSADLLSKIAGILGKSDDVKTYADLSDKITTAYNKAYFDSTTNWYEGKTQTANLLPLAFDITLSDVRAKTIENLVKDIAARDTHLSTGFLGTTFLLPILSENGHHQLAYTLATRETYPSWGYMIKNGATTIWELWNSDKEKPEGMNSRNHFAYGAVGEWMYRYLGGLNPLEEFPGFKKFRIAPMPAQGLDFAEVSYQSMYGTIYSRWQKTADAFTLRVIIPANTSAIIELPTNNSNALVTVNGVEISKSTAGISNAKTENGKVIFEAVSGTYIFSVK